MGPTYKTVNFVLAHLRMHPEWNQNLKQMQILISALTNMYTCDYIEEVPNEAKIYFYSSLLMFMEGL